MTDVELLPLLEPLLVRGDIGGLYTGRECQHYARANVEHHTAPLQAENERLRAEVSGLRAARIAYANEFPATEDGDPDTGNIHANIRALKARAERLAEALRWAERHCPCGARPESPDTHPHLPGCLVGAALAQEDRNG